MEKALRDITYLKLRKSQEKNKWISAKISKLVDEGYPQYQAIAIAHDMWERGDVMKKETVPFEPPKGLTLEKIGEILRSKDYKLLKKWTEESKK